MVRHDRGGATPAVSGTHLDQMSKHATLPVDNRQ
jgi:hypothetical protein